MSFEILDADGHVIEAANTWTDHIDAKYRERAPRPVEGVWMLEGDTVLKPEGAAAGRNAPQRAHHLELVADAHANGYDAKSTLRAFDHEGVAKSFLYPSYGLAVIAYDNMDPAFAAAMCRAYNRWLAGFCAEAPERLLGVGVVPRHDVGLAVKEARVAVREFGMRGIAIAPNPVNGRFLHDPIYDPLWAELQDLDVAVGVHALHRGHHETAGADRFTDSFSKMVPSHPMEQMLACESFIYGGILERFPKLRVLFLESGTGWVPFWISRMDEYFHESGYYEAPELKLTPSEYFKRQCFIGADPTDPHLPYAVKTMGAERFLFSTDYPHQDGKFPVCVKSLMEREDLDAKAKQTIAGSAVAAAYRI